MKTESTTSRRHRAGLPLRTKVRAGEKKNLDDLIRFSGGEILETFYTNQLNRVNGELNKFSDYIKALYTSNLT